MGKSSVGPGYCQFFLLPATFAEVSAQTSRGGFDPLPGSLLNPAEVSVNPAEVFLRTGSRASTLPLEAMVWVV